MSVKVGFLGIGQCGGNIADIAYQRGFPAYAINTAKEDLYALSFKHNKMQVGNTGGAAKDRKVAINELKKTYPQILENVQSWLITESVDIMIITFSTGGGTGSGMGPVLARLMKENFNQIIVLMPVLPSMDEPVGSQSNSVECMNNIIPLGLSTFVIDNNKYMQYLTLNKSKRKLYDGVNSEVLDNIEVLLDNPNKVSKYGNIDTRDILRIFSTPGFTSMGMLFKDNITDSNMIQHITDTFNKSIYAPLEYDKHISCAAFIYMCSEKMMEQFSQDEFYSLMGKPIEVYEGVYDPDDKTIGEHITIILCGLTFPTTRIQEMISRVESEREIISSKKDFTKIDFDSSWINDAKDSNRDSNLSYKTTKKKEKIDEKQATDIFNEYF